MYDSPVMDGFQGGRRKATLPLGAVHAKRPPRDVSSLKSVSMQDIYHTKPLKLLLNFCSNFACFNIAPEASSTNFGKKSQQGQVLIFSHCVPLFCWCLLPSACCFLLGGSTVRGYLVLCCYVVVWVCRLALGTSADLLFGTAKGPNVTGAITKVTQWVPFVLCS